MEERRAWVLSILIFGDVAVAGFNKSAEEVGKGLGKKATVKMPMTVLNGINSAFGRTIVTKYGKKRGVIALGTALPLGFGAVVGGTANYTDVRLLARHANKFFKNLLGLWSIWYRRTSALDGLHRRKLGTRRRVARAISFRRQSRRESRPLRGAASDSIDGTVEAS